MKTSSAIILVFLAAWTGLHAQKPAAGGVGLKMVPANTRAPNAETTSDAQLIARRAKSAATAPVRLPPKESAFGLMAMSTAIQSGAEFTLVPKGAVLYCPPKLADKVVTQPKGKFVAWAQFMNSNRGWITTFEVSNEQVLGKSPLTPETMARFQKGGVFVLATQGGGPISVKHPES